MVARGFNAAESNETRSQCRYMWTQRTCVASYPCSPYILSYTTTLGKIEKKYQNIVYPKVRLPVPFMDSVHTPLTSSLPLDPQYHGWVLILVSTICLPLLLFFVGLRSYVRIWTPRSFALDDGKNNNLRIRVSAYPS